MKNKSLMGTALPFLSVVASLSFASCQDEDFGYDQSDIRQAYLNRKYAEEFKKQFPNADPNHTWMCDPDTFGIESLIGTRAYISGMEPSVTKLTSTKTVDENFIKSALSVLFEGQDNRGLVTQSFDYLAAEDNGTASDNYAEYIITPTFWGRKFCGTNSVGIYWIDNSGNRHDEPIFWHDYAVGESTDNSIKVHYTNGREENLLNSEYQIDHNIVWTNYARDYPLGLPCTDCGVELHAFPRYGESSYLSKNDINGGGQKIAFKDLIVEGGYTCVKIESANEVTNSWDTQLQVTSPHKFSQGEKVHFSMKYLVTSLPDNKSQTEGTFSYQLHNTSNSPNSYVSEGTTGYHIEKGSWDGSQWNWKTLQFDVEIPSKGIDKICINLNPKRTDNNGFDFLGQTMYVTEVSWRKQSCSSCNNLGYYPADNFILPRYLVKIPVGMKWGFYLSTKKQQTSESGYQKYYSNASINYIITDDQKNRGNVSAAATYVGSDGLVYCCFEDAACNLHGGGGTGTCECGYGHYDTDFNDFVFAIEGNPVITSYQALKYRVMCEDLGGTYDWDFNDVVYDVVYADAVNGASNATVQVILQAVGGTFPVYMQFDQNLKENDIINRYQTYNNSNDRLDLHGTLFGQKKDNNGIYLPVNVERDGAQNTLPNQGSRVLCTYYLNAAKNPGIDIRRFVDLIHIYVDQNPKNGGNTVSGVTFPTQKGAANLIPECFMTSVNASWTREHQNIVNKFPGFMNWVNDNKNNNKWWDAGIGM